MTEPPEPQQIELFTYQTIKKPHEGAEYILNHPNGTLESARNPQEMTVILLANILRELMIINRQITRLEK